MIRLDRLRKAQADQLGYHHRDVELSEHGFEPDERIRRKTRWGDLAETVTGQRHDAEIIEQKSLHIPVAQLHRNLIADLKCRGMDKVDQPVKIAPSCARQQITANRANNVIGPDLTAPENALQNHDHSKAEKHRRQTVVRNRPYLRRMRHKLMQHAGKEGAA